MISLPVCRWRGESRTDHCVCTSTKFVAAPNVVSHEFCGKCYYIDHAPPAPLPRAFPCLHMGAATGATVPCPTCKGHVELKVLACALHGECIPARTAADLHGLRNCQCCDDYLAKPPSVPDSGLMRRRADAFLESVPACPEGRFQGRGVVIAGGGERYFASLYVTIRALRHVGCSLPIQVWYLGRFDEMPADRQTLLAPYGVDCIDADAVRVQHPARRLDGWELKVFATLHCSFAEVLFLDADCYPCRNPEFLFELDDYRQRGAIFWPDCVTKDDRLKWPAFGVTDPRRVGSFESGQYVIDKKACWQALNLTWFYNDHSDYYYRYCYGDKHTFEVAWTRLEKQFVMFTPIGRVEQAGYVHVGPDREPLFMHRCSDKFRLAVHKYPTSQRESLPTYHAVLPLEAECWSWLTELARLFGAPVRSPTGQVCRPVHVRPASITLATLYTPEIAAYGELSARVLDAYAKRHGYRAVAESALIDLGRPASWSKIPLIERIFEADPDCEWVMWIDADALIVNHEVALTDILDDDADFIVADDSPHGLLNMGVFMVRRSAAALELFRRAYAKTQYLHHHWWEQAAVVETLREGVSGLRVKIVPRRLFNAFAPEHRIGDFVIHFAGQAHALRFAEIRRRAAPYLHPRLTHFRPDTNDWIIFDDVVTGNEYLLPDDLRGGRVLDVGAHIGTFAYACGLRGAGDIWCVEAHPDNFEVLAKTLTAIESRGARVPILGAAWRSDLAASPLQIHHGDGFNRGGRCLASSGGVLTTLLPFDDIVRQATNGGRRRISLLKLDCEGSEFPILFTSTQLALIDAMCGEYHLFEGQHDAFRVAGRDNDLVSLRNHLEEQGFAVEFEPPNPATGLGHFWARRVVASMT